jgi:predicted nucleotidyltransferase
VTSYPSPLDPAAAAELDAVRKAILPVVGPSLVGLYLFGSLARGEFDTGISDIDLIVVLVDSPDEELAERLVRMHDNLIRANPDWDDRIDVIYISRDGLANCRTDTTTIGVISPGEPFHIVPAGRDWVLDWYPAREDSHPLIGPPIHTLIPPIPTPEYTDELRGYLAGFRKRIDDDATAGSQAYAILSICRGLHTIRYGRRLSKREAAAWLSVSSRVGPTSSVRRLSGATTKATPIARTVVQAWERQTRS